MTLRNLRIFAEVCRFGSITLAAEALNMAQPAVSSVIKELESYYGVRLFERMNRRIYISEAGEQLYSYAVSILEQIEEAKNVLRDTEKSTRIRIGTNLSFGIGNLSELLSAFYERYPEIPVYSMVKNSSQIEEQLLRNNLDIGIIDYPKNHTMFHCQMVGKDTMKAACAESIFQSYSNLKSDEKNEVKIEMLENVPLLLRESGSGSRSQIDHLLEQKGVVSKIVMESDSIQCMLKAAVSGMGVLFLPETILNPYILAGKLREVRISELEIQRKYYLVYHKSKFLTKSMKAFLGYVSEY